MSELKEVCAYVRVSTERQEELSLDSQIRLLKEYASQHNMLLTHIYVEEHGISGKNANKRPAFQEMIAMCKNKSHPYDAILLWKFSRFARNIDESTYYKSILRKKCNVDVISISEPIIEGMYGRLIEMVIEWSDEFYLYNLSGEVVRGMTQKALQGGYNAIMPLGYTKKPGNNNIPEISEKEAAIIKRIFDMYTLEKRALSDIATLLNREGGRTKRGGLFETRTVGYIIENPFYIGKVRWNYYDKENNKRKNEEDVIISQGKHEAIISEKQFAHANRRLAEERAHSCYGKKRTAAASGHWLSGIYKCSACGASLAYQKGDYPSFVCWKKGKGLCDNRNYISEKNAVQKVFDILESLGKESFYFDYRLDLITSDQPHIARLQRELKSIDNKMLRIKEAYINEIDTLEEYKQNKAVLLKRAEELKKEIANAEKVTVIPAAKKRRIDFNEIIDMLKSDSVEPLRKANALRETIEQLEWNQEEDHLNVILSGNIKQNHQTESNLEM